MEYTLSIILLHSVPLRHFYSILILVWTSPQRVTDTLSVFYSFYASWNQSNCSCNQAFTAAWGEAPEVKSGLLFARISVPRQRQSIPERTGLEILDFFPRRPARWRALGTFLWHRSGYMRLSEGRTLAFFPRLHLPTSCSNLRGNNLRQGRGGDICRVNREEELWTKSSTLLWYPLPSPERWGND